MKRQDKVEKQAGNWLPVVVTGCISGCILLTMAMAPALLHRQVQEEFGKISAYDGKVASVEIHPLDFSYTLHDVEILDRTGSVPVPFFSARSIRISLGRFSDFSSRIVSRIEFDRPELNFVDSEDEARVQTGSRADWLSLINQLSPVPVDRVRVNNGVANFRNFDYEESVTVSISNISAWGINLSDAESAPTSLSASTVIQGRLLDAGGVWLMSRFDSQNRTPDFTTKVRVDSVALDRAEELMEIYAPFDVEGGDLSLIAEIESTAGEVDGYIKPLIYDLEIFDWKEDVLRDADNPFTVIWESFTDLTSELLENQQENQLATLIPISGKLENPEMGYLTSIANLLRNAFVDAFDLQFEDQGTALTDY